MKCVTDLDITCLQAVKFMEVTRHDPGAYSCACAYVMEFMDEIQSFASFNPDSITDIPRSAMVSTRRPETVSVQSEVSAAESVEARLIDFSDSESSSSECADESAVG